MNDPPTYRLYVAGGILALYLLISGYLLYHIYNPAPPTTPPTPAPDWDQVVFVFNAIGAIATTAAGVLLGAEVQQGGLNAARRGERHASAQTARREEAMRAALEHLEDAVPTEPDTPVSRARRVLQRALGGAFDDGRD